MRKLLAISVFVSLLLVLTACPSTDNKAPTLTLTSEDATITTAQDYTLKGKVVDDKKVKALTYKVDNGAAQDLAFGNDGTFEKTLKGADLKVGKKKITVIATDENKATTSKEVTVTVTAVPAEQ